MGNPIDSERNLFKFCHSLRGPADSGRFGVGSRVFKPWNLPFGSTSKYWWSDRLTGTLLPGWKTKKTASVARFSKNFDRTWKIDWLVGQGVSLQNNQSGCGLTESGHGHKLFVHISHSIYFYYTQHIVTEYTVFTSQVCKLQPVCSAGSRVTTS